MPPGLLVGQATGLKGQADRLLAARSRRLALTAQPLLVLGLGNRTGSAEPWPHPTLVARQRGRCGVQPGLPSGALHAPSPPILVRSVLVRQCNRAPLRGRAGTVVHQRADRLRQPAGGQRLHRIGRRGGGRHLGGGPLQQSELRLRALGLPGDSDQVCVLGRSNRAPQAEFDAAFAEIAAVHRLLGGYFQALGLLASDKLPLPGTALAGSLSAVKAAGVPVSSAEEAALKSLATLLGRALDGYRQRELRRLIELAHGDVDTSLVLLERLAALYVDEIDGERRQAALYWRCQLSPNGEVLDKYWGRREFKRVADGYAVDLASLKTYALALAQVRRDHAALRETLALDGDALKQALAALAATRNDLDAARVALHRL